MAGRIAGLTVEIGGDTTKLQSALKGVDTQLRTMRTGLRDVDRQLKFNPTSTVLLTQKQQLLKQSIEETKDRLKTLKEAQKQMKDAGVDKNSDDYQRLQREITATEQRLKKLKGEYDSFASVAGAKMQAAGQKMQEFGGKVSAAGEAVTKKLTAAIVAFAGASVKAFIDVDKGMDAVVKKTGATGEALGAMKDSVKNLTTSIPTDFQTAGNAVGEVATRFDLAGQDLENLSGKFVKFSMLNNVDVVQSVDKTQKALAAYGKGADDAGAYLDRLNKAGQDTGVSTEKLLDGIVQNGTAFKQLGLNIDDATVLMGQLEKSGVNSETVLTGMRKALKNAAKEGKPLNQALGEMQDQILNGTDSVDGLTAAYDLFGKSGDQIYGAVKDGMINFKALAGAAGDAGGSVEKTFKNTLDPVDKVKIAMNQVKVAGAELGAAILTRVAPMIDRFKGFISDLTERFKALKPEQQDMVVKIGAIAAAAGPLLMIGGKLISSIGSITSGIGKMMSLIAANPMTALVVGAAAAGVALYGIHKANQKAVESMYDLNKEQAATVDKLNEATASYNQIDAARKEATSQIESEAQYSQELVDEYNGLIDSNGKVKEGYENRANFIKTQLAESLGIEAGQIEDLIGKNGKFKESIEQLIQTKKAEALMDANKEAYAKAIQERQQAVEKLAPALQVLKDKETELTAARKKQAEAQAEYDKYSEEGDNAHARQAKNRLDRATEVANAEQKSYDKAKKAVDGYKATLSKANTEITNYEGLAQAIASKDEAAIQKWSATLTAGIKTRQNATSKELEAQAESINSEYELIKEAYKRGEDGITKDMVDSAKARRDAADKEAGIDRKHREDDAKKLLDTTSTKLGEVNKAANDKLGAFGKAVKDYFGAAKTNATKDMGDIASTTSKKMGQAKGSASSNSGAIKTFITKGLGTAAANAGASFRSIGSSASTQMGSASKSVNGNIENIKKKFPFSIGKLFNFSVPKFDVKKETKGGISLPKILTSLIPHAKNYDNPLLFTSPGLIGNHLFGDRGSHAGGELVYGKESLMNDIRSAVTGTGQTTINITVDGAKDPRQWAQEFVSEYKLYTRMA